MSEDETCLLELDISHVFPMRMGWSGLHLMANTLEEGAEWER